MNSQQLRSIRIIQQFDTLYIRPFHFSQLFIAIHYFLFPTNINLIVCIREREREVDCKERERERSDQLKREIMDNWKDLIHLFVTVFLSNFASLLVNPTIADVTMDAVCPGQDECSLAIYLTGFQQAVRVQCVCVCVCLYYFLFECMQLDFMVNGNTTTGATNLRR